MARSFLRSASPGDAIDDVFVLTNKQIAVTATGKNYIKCFIGDKTAQITARMWNASKETFNALPESGFVHVKGRIENYQNNNQVIIDQLLRPKEGSFSMEDLMPHTTKNIDEMFARVSELCGSIRNRQLLGIVQAFLDDAELMANFRRAPAAMSFHHAFLGGLLEHTLNAMEVANVACAFYPTLNRDLVVAGIFLHDLAKTWELTYATAFAYTDGGQLVGHIVKIALWLEDKARLAAEKLGQPIDRALIDVLQHIVISHHGEPEFGAAKVPATPEAIAVHIIENMDAKLTMSLSATRSEDAGESNWTEYMKAFNGRMYKPDVAPADIAAAGESARTLLTNPLFGEFTKR
ncbi:MAG TPA: HD domain-containing protein [Tepidisphaeraceae bacterium]|jgi:3'-5' exoribonuclease